jgi:hypothetical protein
LLGLAYYRLKRDAEALTILETTAEGERSVNSRLGSQLCLALVQLRLGHLDAARKTIQDARATSEESTWHEEPWGVQASLWREVEAAMGEAGLQEPIPELPVAYSDRPSGSPDETDTANQRNHD